jgi:uncharacterized membrane protein YeaQ/YmgE (transglycosylase-associated protein family)
MEPQTLLIWLGIGAIAGFLAGLVLQGGGFGIAGNILIGILGAVVAGYFFPRLGVTLPIRDPLISAIAVSTVGAIVLLLVLGLVRR